MVAPSRHQPRPRRPHLPQRRVPCHDTAPRAVGVRGMMEVWGWGLVCGDRHLRVLSWWLVLWRSGSEAQARARRSRSMRSSKRFQVRRVFRTARTSRIAHHCRTPAVRR